MSPAPFFLSFFLSPAPCNVNVMTRAEEAISDHAVI